MREHEWPVLAEPSANARGACLPWNSRLVGLTPTSSASVPAPGGRPSGASFALHPPEPNHPGITLRPRREDKSAEAESTFSMTRRCRIIIREFFTTAKEGSSTQEPPSPALPSAAALEGNPVAWCRLPATD